MTLRFGVVGGTLALGVLGVALAFMVGDASGDEWPGWDEGWALIAFPLGVPLAVGAAFGLLRGSGLAARVAGVTAAVWLWGACVFLLWHLLG
jgi:hypothetical protein